MSDRDPAFLWETEALRRARPRTPLPVDPRASTGRPTRGWGTLREAHEATGVPMSTLRKWARRGAIPSYLDARADRSHRMVKMEAVIGRAAEQGRVIAPVVPDADDQDVVVDLRDDPAAPAVTREGVDAPPGTMIVPIAAWDKMLMQLGNLHEAGQQLAEARERAARAETEALFLRERLSELRGEMAATVEAGPPAPPARAAEPTHPIERMPEPVMITPTPPPPSRTAQMWRIMYRSWRLRRRP